MRSLSRRNFLANSLVAGAAFAATGAAAAESADKDRANTIQPAQASPPGRPHQPNILWIQTDEQRPDSLGCYGSAWAKTPNVDRLAAQGMTFHECHVQSPVCVPSRTSMLTGRYPQELGILDNTTAFRDGFMDTNLKTFPELFAAAGYRTANFGKWHTPNHPTWQTNVLFDVFGQVASYYGMGPNYPEGKYRVVKDDGAFKIILGGVYPNHDWGVTPSSHVTDMGINFLQEAAKGGQPFFLRVSHVWPHTPVLVPEPWDKLYRKDEVPCPALNRELYEGRARYDRSFADMQKGMDIAPETWQQMTADYYGLCAYVDYETGRLIRALEELGLAENTIIAFNADHGRSMGEIGLTQKGTYDREVWRVPFILSWPGHIPQGEARHDLMELIDFGPTLLALAGLAPAEGMHGRNLLDSAEPEAVYGAIEILHTRRIGIRTRQYRFDCTVRQDGKPVELVDCDPNLFDLMTDPLEAHNLARDPAHAATIRQMYAAALRWLDAPGEKTVGLPGPRRS